MDWRLPVEERIANIDHLEDVLILEHFDDFLLGLWLCLRLLALETGDK